MTEAQFQTHFSKWAKHHLTRTTVCELKVCHGNRFSFAQLAPHQIANLISARDRRIFYKIPDSGYDQKPFDCFTIAGADAYVVLFFDEKRGEKEFYMIDISRLQPLMADKKSLTREEVKSIATRTERLA